MRHPYFTVGHSNRGTSQFLNILRAAEVGMVVDVRRMPGSRANPQFDQDRLAEALAEFQIGYEHIASWRTLRKSPRCSARVERRLAKPKLPQLCRFCAFRRVPEGT